MDTSSPSVRIGPLRLSPPVVLAPMAGVTDAPFRVMCAAHGGGLFVSEMLTARGLVEGSERSWAMARHHPAEEVRSVQLYGSEPATVAEAARWLVAGNAARDIPPVDHIDLNFGCPVPKVTRHGGGAALPVKRRLLGAVVRAAVRAAGSVPVTVKMRMGLDDDRLTYLDAGRIAAAEGAAAVALHARTAIQGYAGSARWDAITALKESLPDTPVLGNGDIWSADDAVDMVTATGCDGVIVGRGCLGRPWLFGDLRRAFAGEATVGPPPLGEVTGVARRHLALALSWEAPERSEVATVRRFRKHLRWYLQGYPVGPAMHRRAGLVATAADVTALLDAVDPALHVVASAVRGPRGRSGPMARVALPDGWWEDREAEVAVPEPAGLVSGG